MKYHFIAIGGSAMHNLALALHKKGAQITGSDDEIFEPSKSRLAAEGLLPAEIGWFPEKITPQLDAIVLGMHAKADNPELLKAKELGLTIYSYPEFLYNQTINKKRIVVGGSHGKTTTTAMIMHVLKHCGKTFDYMVGAKINGFETMVNLSNDSELAVFEGDEYLTSPIDLRPKFHLYHPHIAIITGIAWDHINVFPTWEIYVEQFRKFINLIQPNGTLIYCASDKELTALAHERRTNNLTILPYTGLQSTNHNGLTKMVTSDGEYPVQIFGAHNMQNLHAALLACQQVGISESQFYGAIGSFTGADKRLQLLAENNHSKVYLDFAHSPSKLEATINAVAEQFPDKTIVACMELHTYSSLSKEFLVQYKHTMGKANKAIVFYSQHALEIKKLEFFDKKNIIEGFDKQGLEVESEASELKKRLFFMEFKNSILLLLSSGNFDGLNLKEMAVELMEKNK